MKQEVELTIVLPRDQMKGGMYKKIIEQMMEETKDLKIRPKLKIIAK